jgi:predicted transcriptional regulator
MSKEEIIDLLSAFGELLSEEIIEESSHPTDETEEALDALVEEGSVEISGEAYSLTAVGRAKYGC